MKHSTFPANSLCFGTYEFDLRSGELRKHGIRIKLQEQPSQILAILLEQRGKMVTREELQRRLWSGDTFVDFDHSLNTAVMRLREALSDSDNPRFIETLPRHGYRFIAPVEEVTSAEPEKHDRSAPAATPEPERGVRHSDAVFPVNSQQTNQRLRDKQIGLRPTLVLGTLLGLVVLVVFGFALRNRQRGTAANAYPNQIKSIVVLPFENLSGDKDQQYFTDGLTDELIAHLAKIRSLRVISRTSSMEYKGTHKSLSQIARDLNVDAVVKDMAPHFSQSLVFCRDEM